MNPCAASLIVDELLALLRLDASSSGPGGFAAGRFAETFPKALLSLDPRARKRLLSAKNSHEARWRIFSLLSRESFHFGQGPEAERKILQRETALMPLRVFNPSRSFFKASAQSALAFCDNHLGPALSMHPPLRRLLSQELRLAPASLLARLCAVARHPLWNSADDAQARSFCHGFSAQDCSAVFQSLLLTSDLARLSAHPRPGAVLEALLEEPSLRAQTQRSALSSYFRSAPGGAPEPLLCALARALPLETLSSCLPLAFSLSGGKLKPGFDGRDALGIYIHERFSPLCAMALASAEAPSSKGIFPKDPLALLETLAQARPLQTDELLKIEAVCLLLGQDPGHYPAFERSGLSASLLLKKRPPLAPANRRL